MKYRIVKYIGLAGTLLVVTGGCRYQSSKIQF